MASVPTASEKSPDAAPEAEDNMVASHQSADVATLPIPQTIPENAHGLLPASLGELVLAVDEPDINKRSLALAIRVAAMWAQGQAQMVTALTSTIQSQQAEAKRLGEENTKVRLENARLTGEKKAAREHRPLKLVAESFGVILAITGIHEFVEGKTGIGTGLVIMAVVLVLMGIFLGNKDATR